MSWKVWVVIACAALAAVLGSGIAFAFTEAGRCAACGYRPSSRNHKTLCGYR
jgi:membrane protein DedA with SNARE-associated domain